MGKKKKGKKKKASTPVDAEATDERGELVEIMDRITAQQEGGSGVGGGGGKRGGSEGG